MSTDSNSPDKGGRPVFPSLAGAPAPLSAAVRAAKEAPPPEQKEPATEKAPASEAPAADVAAAEAPPKKEFKPPVAPPMPQGPPPGARRRGKRPPRDGEEGGKEEKFHFQPTFVPPKSMELGRRGRLSANDEQEIEAALGALNVESLGEAQPKAAQELENDSRHRAQVIDVHGDDVFFSLGGQAQGVMSARAVEQIPEPGTMVDVVVVGFNAEDELYNVMVPGGKVVSGGDWSQIQEGGIVEAKITGSNAGGLECQINDLKGFIPAGQVGLYFTQNLADYVGQKLVCVITQADERRGNVILSRRAILEREKEESRAKLLAELHPGEVMEGVVRKLMDFGAFVDIGNGVDGLIHISQMSWERIKHPSEVLAEGQKVRVRIEKIDQDTGKIGLTLRNPEEHPWTNIDQRFPTGSTIKGPVSRIAQFGAFVKMAPGVEGLIHISELAHHKVFRVENIVKEGDQVECKVLSVDPDAQRIALSLKANIEKPQKEGTPAEPEVEEPVREPAVKRTGSGPLKGGTKSKPSGGEAFGLKW